MISSYEMKSKTMKVIAEKLIRGDAIEEARDTVAFKQGVIQMTLELDGAKAKLFCQYPLCGLRLIPHVHTKTEGVLPC